MTAGRPEGSSGGLPPEGHVVVLQLRRGGVEVEDTLAAVDLHADIQLEVDVALDGRAQEAAARGRAGPALAEQLADGGEARRLL